MNRDLMANLTAFVAVAEEKSFTRAATRLGITQSALSQIIRKLEDRLDLRLLTRTTRSVSVTQAGERILETLRPTLNELDDRISELSDLSARPSGTIRVASIEHATRKYLLPAISNLLLEHPEIAVEVVDDYALFDIVSDRFDAGIRLGHQIDMDMIAVPVSAEIPMKLVASPGYLNKRSAPQSPQDLLSHSCANLWLPETRTGYEWRFRKGARHTKVQVSGAFVSNKIEHIVRAAVDGLGIAYLPADYTQSLIEVGQLVTLLEEWNEPLPAYHLYYPHRRHSSQAFRLFLDKVRYRPSHN